MNKKVFLTVPTEFLVFLAPIQTPMAFYDLPALLNIKSEILETKIDNSMA